MNDIIVETPDFGRFSNNHAIVFPTSSPLLFIVCVNEIFPITQFEHFKYLDSAGIGNCSGFRVIEEAAIEQFNDFLPSLRKGIRSFGLRFHKHIKRCKVIPDKLSDFKFIILADIPYNPWVCDIVAVKDQPLFPDACKAIFNIFGFQTDPRIILLGQSCANAGGLRRAVAQRPGQRTGVPPVDDLRDGAERPGDAQSPRDGVGELLRARRGQEDRTAPALVPGELGHGRGQHQPIKAPLGERAGEADHADAILALHQRKHACRQARRRGYRLSPAACVPRLGPREAEHVARRDEPVPRGEGPEVEQRRSAHEGVVEVEHRSADHAVTVGRTRPPRTPRRRAGARVLRDVDERSRDGRSEAQVGAQVVGIVDGARRLGTVELAGFGVAPAHADGPHAVVPAAEMSRHNANYVDGDIIVGGATLKAAMIGPTLRVNPWTTPIPKAYLCSSATPPGTGVHGMAGLYAARTVLRREFGVKTLPSLAP